MAFRASVVPFANDEFAGVTAIEARLGAPTVSLVEPEIGPDVAEIVAVPAAIPVASPEPLIVAVAEEEELQVALAVRFCVVPSE